MCDWYLISIALRWMGRMRLLRRDENYDSRYEAAYWCWLKLVTCEQSNPCDLSDKFKFPCGAVHFFPVQLPGKHPVSFHSSCRVWLFLSPLHLPWPIEIIQHEIHRESAKTFRQHQLGKGESQLSAALWMAVCPSAAFRLRLKKASIKAVLFSSVGCWWSLLSFFELKSTTETSFAADETLRLGHKKFFCCVQMEK